MRYSANNRRRAPRVAAGGLDAIYLFDSRINSAQVLDLSIGGAMLRSATAPPVGADTVVTFSTGHRAVIHTRARVVARDCHNQRLRVCFLGLGEANKARLRRLVEEFGFEEEMVPYN